MLSNPTLNDLLEDGFTKRFAEEYLMLQKREAESGLFDPDYLAWAHANGFLAESACAYGLTDENKADYLTDYDYWKLWPLNDWQRIWINDKLTLNAMFMDSDLQQYLPEYYYYNAATRLIPLQFSDGRATTEAFLEKLQAEGAFACKPCNGTEASGFHMMEYVDGAYRFDGQEVSAEQLAEELAKLTNYVFTEFIYPDEQMAAINSRIHTIRMLVANEDGANPFPVASYVRFASTGDDEGYKPNYEPPTTADIFSYNTSIDMETGHFGNGKIVYAAKTVDSPNHPATGALAEGDIACWPEVKDMIAKVCAKFSACQYLGFDIGITTKGPKLMEINSHSGIKYLQVYKPLMADPVAGPYYRQRLAQIDALSPEAKKARNGIVR
ncbi:MAG: sugar-transfer associated ATP-grasp domain-containing protein [Coriobacteriia bacterium]|nr:sugar-transfer associated ATP-grasp domain-containing protein [Coriobacteriia bacterium]